MAILIKKELLILLCVAPAFSKRQGQDQTNKKEMKERTK
jgi:hypothetical protein